MKLAQIIDIVWLFFFGKKFAWFSGLDPKFRPLLIYQTTTINQKLIRMSWFSGAVRWLKAVNIILCKLKL